MTRTLPIVALITLAAVAPVLAARAIGSLEPLTAAANSCLDGARIEVAPKIAPAAESGFCSADASGVRP
jgi:hypothetical protein